MTECCSRRFRETAELSRATLLRMLQRVFVAQRPRRRRSLRVGFGQQSRRDSTGESGRLLDFGSDQGSEGGESGPGEFAADSSLMKTVRIVTTVQYYLEN